MTTKSTLEFREEHLRPSYQSVSYADILRNGRMVCSLPVLDGSVDVDRDSHPRRNCRLAVMAEPPFNAIRRGTDVLSPFGNEIKIRKGVRYANGVEELVPLGVFRILRSSHEFGYVTIQGCDRSYMVAESGPFAMSIASGTPGHTALARIIRGRVPHAPFIGYTKWNSPRLFLAANSNWWQTAQDLAFSFGMDLAFDVNGVAMLRPVYTTFSPVSSPSFWVGKGGNILSLRYSVNGEHVPNEIVVESTRSDVVAKGFARDLNPASETYFYGPYGQILETLGNEKFLSASQCTIAARAELEKVIHRVESVEADIMPDPTITEGDICPVTHEEQGVSGLWAVQRFTVPLGPASMPITFHRGLAA